MAGAGANEIWIQIEDGVVCNVEASRPLETQVYICDCDYDSETSPYCPDCGEQTGLTTKWTFPGHPSKRWFGTWTTGGHWCPECEEFKETEEAQETIYCNNEPCEAEATQAFLSEDGVRYYLCATCAQAFEWGTTYPLVTLDLIENVEEGECDG